jgi:hypothetical protein
VAQQLQLCCCCCTPDPATSAPAAATLLGGKLLHLLLQLHLFSRISKLAAAV